PNRRRTHLRPIVNPEMPFVTKSTSQVPADPHRKAKFREIAAASSPRIATTENMAWLSTPRVPSPALWNAPTDKALPAPGWIGSRKAGLQKLARSIGRLFRRDPGNLWPRWNAPGRGLSHADCDATRDRRMAARCVRQTI